MTAPHLLPTPSPWTCRFEAVDQGVVADGSGVRGTPAKRIEVAITGASNVIRRHRGERQQLNGVNFDDSAVARVTTTSLDLRPLPQPDRHRDVACGDALAQFRAEHHDVTVRPSMDVRLDCRSSQISFDLRATKALKIGGDGMLKTG
jgi:hypothetical protein